MWEFFLQPRGYLRLCPVMGKFLNGNPVFCMERYQGA
jgi:hypothetical protein